MIKACTELDGYHNIPFIVHVDVDLSTPTKSETASKPSKTPHSDLICKYIFKISNTKGLSTAAVNKPLVIQKIIHVPVYMYIYLLLQIFSY